MTVVRNLVIVIVTTNLVISWSQIVLGERKAILTDCLTFSGLCSMRLFPEEREPLRRFEAPGAPVLSVEELQAELHSLRTARGGRRGSLQVRLTKPPQWSRPTCLPSFVILLSSASLSFFYFSSLLSCRSPARRGPWHPRLPRQVDLGRTFRRLFLRGDVLWRAQKAYPRRRTHGIRTGTFLVYRFWNRSFISARSRPSSHFLLSSFLEFYHRSRRPSEKRTKTSFFQEEERKVFRSSGLVQFPHFDF